MALLSDFIGGGAAVETAIFQDIQASGVAGQILAATAAGSQLQLNTETLARDWASLASDQITLDAGEYLITVTCTFVASEQVTFWAKDDGGTPINGAQATGASDSGLVTCTFPVTLLASTTLEIWGRPNSAAPLGITQSITDGSMYYQQVFVQKIG